MQEPAGLRGWIELFRSLGLALFEVLRAEMEALGEDLRRSGGQLLRGLALLGGAAAVGFWTLGVLVAALIAVLAIWLPAWAAALLVAALFAGTAGLLAALGWRRLRRLETPAASIRRRVEDHLDWWQHGLLAEPPELSAGGDGRLPAAGGRAGGAGRGGSPPPGPQGPPGRTRIHPDDPLEEDDL
ncbi:MAG TPA: phage holin family protein [Thermoanaerobaculia bacterium]|nr:phage holin family protein [Thermoanaerobaculia bacterium]